VTITPDSQDAIAQALCELLRDSEDPVIRAKAAIALGKLGMESTIANLCKAIKDPDQQVVLDAIDALVLIAKSEFSSPMTESPKNQPTFHINQVGNLNTGDIEIQGDQVGLRANPHRSRRRNSATAQPTRNHLSQHLPLRIRATNPHQHPPPRYPAGWRHRTDQNPLSIGRYSDRNGDEMVGNCQALAEPIAPLETWIYR
jgi:HEAT repeat protein